jgi:release factor glutamine methyltransferase
MAHIVGECEFYGRAFLTDPRALIPRPETELLVETAVELLRDGPPDPLVVDVGTGTGCIGITLLLETPARVVLSDVSYAALQLARLNLSRYGLTDRVQLVRGDLLSWLSSPADLVVANLPYIPSEAFLDLSPDVRDYEPRLALDGGPGGTKLLLELLRQASACQVGALLAELDPRQADILSIAARRMFPDRPIHVLPDLAGHRRLLRVGWPT